MENNKRYQVFVSSTFKDLREERSAVVSTLLNLDAIPAGMELFPATDDDAWTLIEDVITDSDYYLLIIAGKYGSVDPKTGISFTEREYDTAVRLGKPVMAFIHSDLSKLLSGKTEDGEENRKKLLEFRNKVISTKHVKFWDDSADLAAKLALSWNSFRRRHDATGWVKADQVTSKESFEELAKARAEIKDLKIQLDKVRTQAPPGTENMAQGEQKFLLMINVEGTWESEIGKQFRLKIKVEVALTWNRVFGSFGLKMMQEADEKALVNALKAVVVKDNRFLLREKFYRKAEEEAYNENSKLEGFKLKPITLAQEDFQTILLQLKALGLIQHSTRPRSVKDNESYWTLTPYGHTRLVQLRALSAEETSLEQHIENLKEEEVVIEDRNLANLPFD